MAEFKDSNTYFYRTSDGTMLSTYLLKNTVWKWQNLMYLVQLKGIDELVKFKFILYQLII